MANPLSKFIGKIFSVNGINAQEVQKKELSPEDFKGLLTCDLSYFKNKMDYILFLGAEIYQMKKKERYLTTDEKKRLQLLEEDLNLHLRDLYEKCGVSIPPEKVFSAFEEDPDLLEQLSKASFEMKLGEEKK